MSMISPKRVYLNRKPLIDSKPLPVSAWRYAGVALKEGTEKDLVLITDGLTDLLHRAMIAFQHPLGGCNPQFLQVGQRTVAGRFLEAAHEVSWAHAHAMRRLLQ